MTINLRDPFLKRDKWIKGIRKTFNPESLADLIKKRLDSPNLYGPFVYNRQDEAPEAIITALMLDNVEIKNKMVPAIGLILYEILNNKIEENHNYLRGLFSIIKDTNLKECELLVRKWLVKQSDAIRSNDIKLKTTYRDALMAFAKVQDKTTENANWWHHMWRHGPSAFWSAAFYGLRHNNPLYIKNELRLFIARKFEKTPTVLSNIWKDLNSRSYLEEAIANGLSNNTGYAGLTLNMLYSALDGENKTELMDHLNDLIKKING